MSRERGKGKFRTIHVLPLSLLVISLIILSISTKAISTFPSFLASTIGGGVQKAFAAVGGAVSKTIFSIRELAVLKNQYESLAGKMESYSNLEREFADMKAENLRLKEQLDLSSNLPRVVASAKIVAKDPGNVYSTFVIDKGSSKGLRKNQAVAAFQNGIEGLVGRVLEVRGGTSVVLPLFDQRFFVSARLSRTRAEGLVSGRGNPDALLEMKHISRLNASEIQVGDLVITSGLDSLYPEDLAIGRVKEVILPEYSSSATLLLEPSLDFAKLEYLFVLEGHRELER
ncbi:MAG TPA: rod shape-determining protein MreC [Rectinemataceae bacterium]